MLDIKTLAFWKSDTYWPVYYLSAQIWCQQNVVVYRNCSLQVLWRRHIVSEAPGPDRLELLSSQYSSDWWPSVHTPQLRPLLSGTCQQLAGTSRITWPLSDQAGESLLKALSFHLTLNYFISITGKGHNHQHLNGLSIAPLMLVLLWGRDLGSETDITQHCLFGKWTVQ